MRIHIADLEHEIAKARRELEILRGAHWLVENRLRDIQSDMDELEDYLGMLEDPDILEPCSSVARAAGCTCTMRSVSPDHPPEPVSSRHCPLHGEDP